MGFRFWMNQQAGMPQSRAVKKRKQFESRSEHSSRRRNKPQLGKKRVRALRPFSDITGERERGITLIWLAISLARLRLAWTGVLTLLPYHADTVTVTVLVRPIPNVRVWYIHNEPHRTLTYHHYLRDTV